MIALLIITKTVGKTNQVNGQIMIHRYNGYQTATDNKKELLIPVL